jgi:tetratricopeptide (TPR) repeat protein
MNKSGSPKQPYTPSPWMVKRQRPGILLWRDAMLFMEGFLIFWLLLVVFFPKIPYINPLIFTDGNVNLIIFCVVLFSLYVLSFLRSRPFSFYPIPLWIHSFPFLPGLENNFRLMLELKERAARDPRWLDQLVIVIEELLKRLPAGEYQNHRAALNGELSVIYDEREGGDPLENQARAVQACQEQLAIWTAFRYPLEYSRVNNHLGNIYRKLADRIPENFNLALDCYQKALSVYPEKVLSLEVSNIYLNLGMLFIGCPQGDPIKSSDIGLKCLERAFSVLPKKGYQDQRRSIYFALGHAFENRHEENRREWALQQSAAYYHEALKHSDADSPPLQVAHIRFNLARVYTELLDFDNDKLAPQAVALLEENIGVLIKEKKPDLLADCQFYLGKVYLWMAGEDQPDYFQKAQENFEKVLDVINGEEQRPVYGLLQLYLGDCWRLKPPGEDPAPNLEKAQAYYQAALPYFPSHEDPNEYCRVQHGLAEVFLARPDGSRLENEQQALACMNSIWELITTLDPSVPSQARAHYRFGRFFVRLEQGDRLNHLAQARQHFQESLRLLAEHPEISGTEIIRDELVKIEEEIKRVEA